MPLPREGRALDYSRWQQNLIGVLQADISYHPNVVMDTESIITIDARLAYRNKNDPDNGWKHHSSSLEKRNLECTTEIVSICQQPDLT